ncbi:MAG TPA: Gfo/Idh/MocA family oxidoreductase [Abditibacteriaceae bacterium]|jgi:predicted dehydrogenase
MNCILTGLGGRGLHWLSIVRKYEGVDIVAFVEPFESSITRAVEKHDVPREQIFSTLEEAIANSNADFVLDVTPPKIHREVAEKAFAAGLDVLGEKPLSESYADALEVVEAGKAAGRIHMITQNYRFGGQPRTMRRLIDEGVIGKPGQCDVRFYMPWADFPGTHYVTEPYMLINDMMVHHFDLLRYTLGESPESVQAITWNQPWGWHAGDACHAIVFEYPSGLRATHICVACAVGSQTQWNGDWRIEGPEGSLDVSSKGISFSHLHRVENKETREIETDAVKPSEVAILDEFLDACRTRREPECSAADNLNSLAMVFAAIQSAKEGRRVRLDELQ